MKTAREYIRRITVVKSNLQHIADTGAINGSLLADIDRSRREYAKEVAREALKNASDNATFNVTGILTNNQYKEKSLLYEKGVGNRVVERTITINKQSILDDKNIPEL